LTIFFRKNSLQNQRGFSLIELLVSIAIFTILSGIVMFSFSDVRKHDELRESSEQLSSYLRQAQNLAMTGQKVNGSNPPKGGYGIYIDILSASRTYQLFADYVGASPACDSDKPNERYDGELCGDRIIQGGSHTLKNNVNYYKIKVTKADGSIVEVNDLINIVFKPPKPVPYVAYGANSSSSGLTVEIYLQHQKTHQCRKVTVIGPSGQINEQQLDTCP
jgi:prepilin-type N-terminal cleavage/methylation domain-containing protein